MLFDVACCLLAIGVEENVRSCGPAHVSNNTLLVPLLENSHFYIVVRDDRVRSFSPCVVFGGEGLCIPLVRCALLWFCASVHYLPLVLIYKI
jgi:hypothetical protein